MSASAGRGGRDAVQRGEDRDRLARWLHEWRIDRVVREASRAEFPERGDPVPTSGARACGDAAALVKGLAGSLVDEALPSVGQIRLVSPVLAAGRDRPLYLAVLRRLGGRFLIAPYGRFAEPALPGELLTCRREPALSVLCLWNARLVHAGVLRRTWLAGEMEDNELAEALAVHAALTGNGEAPPPLRARVGPPLFHPRDPRREYIVEEDLALDALAAGVETAETKAQAHGGVYREPGRTTLPLAADPKTRYGADAKTEEDPGT